MKIIFHKKGLIIYFLILILSVVFASYYGGNVAFVWLYAIMLLFPVSFLYVIINFKFLSVFQEIEVHRVSKGENHRFRIVLENTGIFSIHKMSLIIYQERCKFAELMDGEQISLSAHEKRELETDITCRYAGTYDVGIEKVSFDDPFGMFTVIFDVPYSFRAIVSPRITDMAYKYLDIENPVNSMGLKSADMYEETPGNDLRAYIKGDPISSINWKVSARLNELVVRVPDRMEKKTVTIILEASNVPEIDQDTEFLKKRDHFLEFAVSAAWHFGEQKVPVKLIYPAGDIKEIVVDSYESFMEFFNTASDGIYYRSDEDVSRLRKIAGERRNSLYDRDTRILIREEPKSGESFCTVIG